MAMFLLAISLYAQPIVSSGVFVEYGIAITKTDIAENPGGKISHQYLVGDIDFSYATKNGLTFGAKGGFLVGFYELNGGGSVIFPFTHWGMGFKAGLALGYTHITRNEVQVLEYAHANKITFQILVFPVSISYLKTLFNFSYLDNFIDLLDTIAIMDYSTSIQVSYVLSTPTKKTIWNMFLGSTTLNVGLDINWGQQIGDTLSNASFNPQFGIGLSLGLKTTFIF